MKTPAFASRALGLVAQVVPKRIADEELGDALEIIDHIVQQQLPPWQVHLKVASTIVCVLINTIRRSAWRLAVGAKPRQKKG